MLGKTHMMVGIAATLAITHPDTLADKYQYPGGHGS